VAAMCPSPGLTPAMARTIVQRLSPLLAVVNFVRKETSVRPSPTTIRVDTGGIPVVYRIMPRLATQNSLSFAGPLETLHRKGAK
jgi:hypothetical protein